MLMPPGSWTFLDAARAGALLPRAGVEIVDINHDLEPKSGTIVGIGNNKLFLRRPRRRP